MFSRAARLRHPQRRVVRLAATAGMVAPCLFVGVFTAERWLRPGYHPVSMFVSELSLGPGGWVQIVSFLVSGALVAFFGYGAGVPFHGGPGGTAGPILLEIIGASLMASGPFVTDPSALFNQHTVHSIVHGVFGAAVFSLAPATCVVFYRRFRHDPTWQDFAGWTLAGAAVLIAGIVILKVAQVPHGALFGYQGLIQRVVLVAFLGWVFTIAMRLRRSVRG